MSDNNSLSFSDLQAIASHYGHGRQRRSKNGFVTLCPLHGDRNPSLSLTIDQNGRLLVHCFSGCDDMAVKRQIEADFPNLFNGRKPKASTASKGNPKRASLPVRIWEREAQPLSDLSLRYLRETRKIDIADEEANFFFRENRYKGRICLIAPYREGPKGPVRGVYRIYLKEGNPPQKESCADLGESKGNAVWLLEPDDKLAIAEGAETACSFLLATKIPTAVTGGKSNLAELSIPSTVKTIYILADQDPRDPSNDREGQTAGQDMAMRAGEAYEAQGFETFVVSPSDDTFKSRVTKKLDFNDLTSEEIRERFKKKFPLYKLRVTDASQYPEPKPIEDELPPVEPYDPDCLPSPLKEYVEDVSQRMPCAPEFVAVPLLVVLGSLIGTTAQLQMRQQDTNWRVVPNLWGLLVGPPSSRKSPPLRTVLRDTLNPLIKRAEEDYSLLQAEIQASAEAFQAKYNALKEEMKKTAKKIHQGEATEEELERLKNELSKMEAQKPEPPSERRYLIHDGTVEAVGELLNRNPRGLLLFRDELTGLFKQCERPGNEGSLQFYYEAWNGTGSYSFDRIGRGHVSCSNFCLSLLGGIQPDNFKKYIIKAINGGNDGFLQRLQLAVYPNPVRIDNWKDRPPNEAIIKDVRDICHKLDALSEPILLKFTPEAQQVFYKFEREMNDNVKGEHPIIEGHLIKLINLCGKLALIFYVVDCLLNNRAIVAVDTDALLQAKSWCMFLTSHMYRIYSLGLKSQQNEGTSRLGNKLISLNLAGKTISLRGIQRKGWAFLQTQEEIQSAIQKLIEHGWLIKQETGQPKKGRPPSPKYLVNPRITQLKQD